MNRCSEYVMSFPEATLFLEKVKDLLAFLIPRYEEEGKCYLTIGIGCTGGHHRSVVLAEEIRALARGAGDSTAMRHRDIDTMTSGRHQAPPRDDHAGLAGPKVVALGGGHGLACTLKAVKAYASEITAIVAVADDGGSSGRLTSGLGVPPPGDIRRCLLALTPERSIWAELFAHRFSGGDIEDHSLGNLLLAALADITGDFAAGVDVAGQMLSVVGKVVPAANEPAELRAIAGGREVVGQALSPRLAISRRCSWAPTTSLPIRRRWRRSGRPISWSWVRAASTPH